MQKTIEKLLKEKIGTAFIHDDTNGVKVFVLKGYGRGVFIVYDSVNKEEKFTRIIYPAIDMFVVDLLQDQKHYNEFLVAGIKMMIEMRKKVAPNEN